MRIDATEDDVRLQVTEYLQLKRWFVIENIAGKLEVGDAWVTHPGISDLTVIKAGRVVWLELKRPKGIKARAGTQSKNQKQFQADIESHGGEYLLAYGIDDLLTAGI